MYEQCKNGNGPNFNSNSQTLHYDHYSVQYEIVIKSNEPLCAKSTGVEIPVISIAVFCLLHRTLKDYLFLASLGGISGIRIPE